MMDYISKAEDSGKDNNKEMKRAEVSEKKEETMTKEDYNEKVEKQPENENEEESQGAEASWWGGWTLEKAIGTMQTATNQAVIVATQKSTEVYTLVRQDLTEVSSQTTNVLGSAAANLKKKLEDIDQKTDEMADEAVEKLKKSMTNLWKYAAGYDQLEDFSEPVAMSKDGQMIHLDRKQAQLYTIASDPATFLEKCDSEKSQDEQPEEALNFKFDLDAKQEEITKLIESDSTLVTHYMSLVPEKVSHKLFWLRYFFKVHLLDIQEAKREALKKRVEETRLDLDGDLNWEDLDDGDNKYTNKTKADKHENHKELELKSKPQSDKDKDSPLSDDWEKLSNE